MAGIFSKNKNSSTEQNAKSLSAPSEGTVSSASVNDQKKSRGDADRKRMYEEDPVTGAYNMFSFLEHVEADRSELPAEKWKDTSIVYFNISTFRIYNDTFGLQQGNHCLRQISELIRTVFQTDLIARFYADHFLVYYTGDDVLDKVSVCHERVLKLKKSFQLWLKAGIVHPTNEMSLSAWCDNARIACDAIARKGLDYCRVYTKSLSDDLIRKKYIQDNIDDAILHGNILVYYQPVIRSLTEKICSMEALARWDDPTYGFLSPDEFVPVLEERHLSYKLDSFVVEQVCHDLSRQKKKGLPIIPVSFNFSRRDFAACDPLEVVESAAGKYDIEPEYLIIEITESAVMDDPDAVNDLISRFHHAGYTVWMDDFGSAYSSLNTLSKFDFDLIKLDLVFMKNFNDRTKAIIRHVINMAKELHVHTLCEGVETREQLDFLKDIGCEKIQGYYYGRPLPLAKQAVQFKEKKYEPENATERAAFDILGLTVFPADQMFLIAEYQDKNIHIIYPSLSLKEHFFTIGFQMTPNEMDEVANSNQTSIGINLRSAALKASISKETIVSYIVVGPKSYRFHVRCAANVQNIRLLWVECADITGNTPVDEESRYRGILRNIANTYHTVYRIDPRNRLMEVVRSEIIGEKAGDIIDTLPSPTLDALIYWEDKDRFYFESTPDFIQSHLKKSSRGYYTLFYRMKYPDGDYKWTAVMISGIFLDGRTQYLCCLKEICREDTSSLISVGSNADPKSSALSDDLWTSLIHQSDLEFFWKDTKGRIIGASDSYFKNRHTSPDKIIGRNDHEIGWHINDRELMRDDESVLKHGHILNGKTEEYTEGGKIHHICTSKFPIYHNGDITGIMGYVQNIDDGLTSHLTPEDSILSSGLDFLHAYSDYELNYCQNGDDYSLSIVYISAIQYMEKTYGTEASADLIRQLRKLAVEDLDNIAVITRISMDVFVILSRSTKLPEETAAWCAHMKKIHHVAGHSCSVRGYYGATLRSRVTNPYQMYTASFSLLSIHDGSYSKLSLEMLLLRIEEYKKLFDIVQVIDPRRQKKIIFNSKGMPEDIGNCWAAMGGTSRCLNCTAIQCLRTHKNTIKLDIFSGSFFVVRSFYVEVNGFPCVIECAQHLNKGLFTSSNGKDLVSNRIVELNYEVYTDRLTNVRNRRFYDEQLAENTAEAVAFIDIDNFKHCNDTYGHHAGDIILHEFAQTVLSVLKAGEHLVRYGGDEFIIVYEEMKSSDELLRNLEQIQEDIVNIRIKKDGLRDVRCSASIGAVFGKGIVKDMVLKADHQLYRAKALHKGSICLNQMDENGDEQS